MRTPVIPRHFSEHVERTYGIGPAQLARMVRETVAEIREEVREAAAAAPAREVREAAETPAATTKRPVLVSDEAPVVGSTTMTDEEWLKDRQAAFADITFAPGPSPFEQGFAWKD